MIARKTNVAEMEKALAVINKKYDGNIDWNRFQPERNKIIFTLRVQNSKDPGAKRGFSGRRTAHACWHAHGDFFDALFAINPEAVIVSRGQKITKDNGNWQDANIGSMMQPLMWSEACDCRKTSVRRLGKRA